MDPFLKYLGSLDAGHLLDIATSHGDFLRELAISFLSVTELLGIDISEERINLARERSDGKFKYQVMDAEHLDFPDSSFNTVAMRHSLHHLANPDLVLREMCRVLRPGGLLIIGETIQDPKTEQPNSYRHNHHWWAKVDRVKGIPHNETYTADEVIAAVQKLPVNVTKSWEFIDEPPESEMTEAFEQTLQHTKDVVDELRAMGGHEDLVAEGEAIVANLERNGVSWEKIVYVIARKRED
jgi:ubiquinone/menaquinone biosynthesis C-methylase UbiE